MVQDCRMWSVLKTCKSKIHIHVSIKWTCKWTQYHMARYILQPKSDSLLVESSIFLFVFNYLTLKVLVHKIQNFIIILHLSISTNTLVQIKKNMMKLLQRLLALNTYILQRKNYIIMIRVKFSPNNSPFFNVFRLQ